VFLSEESKKTQQQKFAKFGKFADSRQHAQASLSTYGGQRVRKGKKKKKSQQNLAFLRLFS
jgi:hypothetical protein